MSYPAWSENDPEDFPAVPAYQISNACLHFMMRRTEHRDFNAHYHDLARRALNGARRQREEVYERYRRQSQYYLEHYLCRIHDIVLLYFEDLVYEAYFSKRTIFSDDLLRIKPGTSAQDHAKAAKRLIHRSAAKPMLDFLEFISENIWPLPLDDEQRTSFHTLAALRNLIVHNDTLPDDRFFDRMSGTVFNYEELPGGRVKLDENWLVSQPALYERTIFQFDRDATRGLSMPTRFRYSIFWAR